MMSEIFNSLYIKLLEHKNIIVDVSQELDIWNDADDKNQKTVTEFFDEFIFSYGIFHQLLEKSDALGDYHKLKLSLIDGNILMEGKTHITGECEEEDLEEPEEKSFIDKLKIWQ